MLWWCETKYSNGREIGVSKIARRCHNRNVKMIQKGITCI